MTKKGEEKKEDCKKSWRVPLFIGLGILGVFVLVSGVSAAIAVTHKDSMLPGMKVAGISVGGMEQVELAQALSELTTEIIDDGITLTHEGVMKTVALRQDGLSDPDASIDLILWNTDEVLNEAFAFSHPESSVASIYRPIIALFRSYELNAELDTTRIEDAILVEYIDVHEPSVDAALIIEQTADSWSVEVTESNSGMVVDTSSALDAIETHAENLEMVTIAISSSVEYPSVTTEEAESLIDGTIQLLETNPEVTLIYEEKEWEVTTDDIVNLLAAKSSGEGPRLGMDDEKTITFMRELVEDELREPQDAKFSFDAGRASEFEGSRNGVDLDDETSVSTFKTAVFRGDEYAELVFIETEPDITVADVNDLGITEVIGIGISDFSGSPSNRISNIKNGARLLNGIVIPAEETFSLVEALEPFTFDNGYLPYLVIKGDEIIPELGGGLCQIGTTTFRATMNSGLEIVERRNHSLVVNYYNDPSNGYPGTDATIYDPAPDYKFKNDTDHAILIETDVNVSTGILTFTFWGTSDGRNGYYSAPTVTSWVGAGETQYIETLDLEPGVTQCQGAHPGASAHFTYTVENADGTISEEVFTSTYRPLPTICLVGVEELSEDTEGEEDEDGENTESEEGGEEILPLPEGELEGVGDKEDEDPIETSAEEE